MTTTTPPHADDDLRWPTLKPPLKWAGGKRWLVPRLRALWRGYTRRRLVEPFCGGLAAALGLDPRRALLNDTNPHLVNFYRHLRSGLVVKIPMEYDSELYYRHRDDFNRLAATARGRESRTAAELFYYLNRTGFNGLCRFNKRGTFNVPFGRHTGIAYVRDFRPYAEPLSRWTFTDGDFESIEVSPKDFIYADPPYDVQFRQYASDGFDWDAQERLAAWLTPVRWWRRIRRRIESRPCTATTGSKWSCSKDLGESAAPATALRRRKSSRHATRPDCDKEAGSRAHPAAVAVSRDFAKRESHATRIQSVSCGAGEDDL